MASILWGGTEFFSASVEGGVSKWTRQLTGIRVGVVVVGGGGYF